VDRTEAGGFGDSQHPADFPEALLGIDEVGDGHDGSFVFLDPIAAGEPGIENPVVYIASHFLGANEHALDLGIVDAGEIGTAAGGDGETGAAEQVDGGVFQAAFGDAEFEYHERPPYTFSGS